MYIVNATEFQNNFGKYLQIVQTEERSLFSKTADRLQDLYQTKAAHLFLQTL